jgi:hypothetical protein
MILISKCIDCAGSRGQRSLNDPGVVFTFSGATPVLLLLRVATARSRIFNLCSLLPCFILVVMATSASLVVMIMIFVRSPSAPLFIPGFIISLFLEDSDLFPE